MNKAHHLPKRNYRTAHAMPLDIGTIHFVGIGGIGMSGIAEILYNLGYKVAGSDTSENANVQRLRSMGITVTIGQKEENVQDVSVVVKSTAVPETNPEIVAARKRQIPVVRRSEMLAELTHLKATIAVAGTHGKTTTTSMIAQVLAEGRLDPTVINGGIINAYGTNAYLGKGDWLVAEADESDGTFIRIPATVGVVTNIDPEHLDYWGDYEALKQAFHDFIRNLPFYGFAVLCYDHKPVKEMAAGITGRRIIGYGIDDEDADIKVLECETDAGGSRVLVRLGNRVTGKQAHTTEYRIPVPGRHNVLNALAALAVGLELGVKETSIQKALARFSGVKRRFTKTGEVEGVTIIDDYAHHPAEIAATLSAARQANKNGRVIAVAQPHRYTRLSSLFDRFADCFSDADIVVVADVYAAGEEPIPGASREKLAEALRERGKQTHLLKDASALPALVQELAKPGDFVVCMGAGSITYWANALPAQLEEAGKVRKAG